MHIDSSESNTKVVGPMKIREARLTPQFSGAIIEIDGNHGWVRCRAEDRIYYIAGGSGEFFVGEEKYDVKEDDVVFVPKMTKYNFIGKMKIFLVCSPEFDISHDEFLSEE